MNNNTKERIKSFISSLNREQLEKLTLTCLVELIETDEVHIYCDDENNIINPYWEASGNYLIDTDKK